MERFVPKIRQSIRKKRQMPPRKINTIANAYTEMKSGECIALERLGKILSKRPLTQGRTAVLR